MLFISVRYLIGIYIFPYPVDTSNFCTVVGEVLTYYGLHCIIEQNTDNIYCPNRLFDSVILEVRAEEK